ncbi:MAG: hypothetical protein D6786_05035 [Gammaproteobacteria bacterium]|nr:MAG: hypothetical protein D6786_05035 [Gammaproteobacteria bacterium]
MTHLRSCPRLIPVIIASTLFPAAAQAAPRADFEVLVESTSGSILSLDLNDRGEVVGNFSGSVQPFLWRSGSVQYLDLPSGASAAGASAINNHGVVVGSATFAGSDQPVVWSADGTAHTIGPAVSAAYYANDINDNGLIAGGSPSFLWQSGSTTVLPSGFGYLKAINNSGYAVGDDSGSPRHAVYWNGWSVVNLGTLYGSATSESRAYAINDHDEVVGISDKRAFLWREGEGMRDLGLLPGDPSTYVSTATSINNAGQVVGHSGYRAFLWNDGVMSDLTALLGFPAGASAGAEAINGHAQVAGEASTSNVHGDAIHSAWLLTLHPDWEGGDGYWDDWGGEHWNWAGTGTAAAQVGEMHDVVINPGVSATVYGSLDGRARSLVLGGDNGVKASLDLGGGTTTVLEGTTVSGGGRLMGQGRHEGDVTIERDGELLVTQGQTMQISGSLTQGANSTLNVLASSDAMYPAVLEVTGTGGFQTDGQVNLRNAHLKVEHGIRNLNANVDSRLNLYGTVDVSGEVSLYAGNRVQVSGPGSEALFWDPFVNNGEVVVTSGSVATFFGLVTGNGTFTGAGTKHFAGGLNPGSSPGLLTLGGDVQFLGGDLIMELGGTTPGTEHDKIVFTSESTVTIDGTALQVEWWGGFTAAAGDLFDLFDWNGVLTGSFVPVNLPSLDPGLAWDTSDLYNGGTLKVSAVPLPPSLWLALGVFSLLGWIGWRSGAIH